VKKSSSSANKGFGKRKALISGFIDHSAFYYTYLFYFWLLMLSKAQNKYIRSLTQQKFRNEYKAFMAEGEKIAAEWLASATPIKMILVTEEMAERYRGAIAKHKEAELHVVKEHEIEAVSTLQTPGKILLVVPLTEPKEIPFLNEWYLALDQVQDPGNMGSIIRIADWFGIRHVVCSPGCADAYNPKVVQSGMGSHLRVNIYESELAPFLTKTKLPKFAATLDGENVYQVKRQDAGVLIIGNESKGVSADVQALATQKVLIPRKGRAESLNAGIATGILCALLLPC
jgi:TrmH family RNA methyltransferase